MSNSARNMQMRHANATMASSIYSVDVAGNPQPAPSGRAPVAPRQPDRIPSEPAYPTRNGSVRVLTRKGKILEAGKTTRQSTIPQQHGVIKIGIDSNPARPTFVQSPLMRVQDGPAQALAKLEGQSYQPYPPPRVESRGWQIDVASNRQQHQPPNAALSPPSAAGRISTNGDRMTAKQWSVETPAAGRNVYVAPSDHIEVPVVIRGGQVAPSLVRTSSMCPRNLLRRLSDTMKGVFRSRSDAKKRLITRPVNFHDFDPCHPGADLHPEVKGIPVAEAQKRFSKESHPTRAEPKHLEEPVYPDRTLHDLEAQTVFDGTAVVLRPIRRLSWRKQAPKPQPMCQPAEATPRQVKVVEDPDNETLYGDFIDAAKGSTMNLNSHEKSSGKTRMRFVEHVRQSFRPPSLTLREQFSRPELAPAPLALPKRRPIPPQTEPDPRMFDVPARKPVRKVVTPSERSWMRPNSERGSIHHVTKPAPSLPRTAKVTSAHDWRMNEEFPAVKDLFGRIDSWMKGTDDEYGRYRASVDMSDQEPEIIIDTHEHDSHVDWVATGRFQRQDHDIYRDRDEAARMMERMRRMRTGDSGEWPK